MNVLMVNSVRFTHTGADISLHTYWNSPSLNLFVFVIHTRQQVVHEMESHKTRTGYIVLNFVRQNFILASPDINFLPKCLNIINV